MSNTTNKNLERPNNGDYPDTWNVPLNADMTNIDAALGGVTLLNATAGSATLSSNVAVTGNYINSVLSVSGAMTANVVYTIPSGVGGQWIVRNNTTDSTGGPWTVTIASGGGGDSVVVLRDKNIVVWSDGTNIRAIQPNVISTGTVTSVDVSGGTTGLTTSGGPVTTNGTITLGGTLGTANGGTGLTTFASANAALYSTSNSALTSGTLPVEAGGTGATTSTGTGSVVLSNSAVLITPNIGTPSFVVLSNATGLPINNGTTGTLPVSRGGTGLTTLTANNVILGNGNSAPTFVAPSTNGNVLTSNGTSWISAPISGLPTQTGNAGTVLTTDGSSAAWGSAVYLQTSKSYSSGTPIDFTGIPSWVKRVTILFSAASMSGNDDFLVQLGTGSSVFATSGYTGGVGLGGSSGGTIFGGSGFELTSPASASSGMTCSGIVTICNLTGNTWVESAQFTRYDSGAAVVTVFGSNGQVTLSAALTCVRLKGTGSNTYDAGTFNIIWE